MTPREGSGISKRNLRLKLAREAWNTLQNTQDLAERIKLMGLIERLTSGRKTGKANPRAKKQDIFAQS